MIHSENRLAPRMVLIITNHEYRRKLEQTFQNFRIPIYYQCQGHGTAPSEMLDIFGLSGSSRLLTIGLLPKFLVLGISMQEEEEFVVIVTPREKKAAVMNAISDACGLRTDAHGIILSLPVDEVIGLETGENTL